jgi:hypothetical protein
MLRFWLVALAIIGIAVAALVLSAPTSRRWPIWVARLWVATVVVTAIGIVAVTVYSS